MRNMLGIRLPESPNIHLSFAEQTVARLHDAGVPLLAGTDSPVPGVAHGASLHRELELLVDSGLSPSEALMAATYTPAHEFGLHDRGRVAAGLRADLVLIKGDPTSNLRALHDIEGVWSGGERHPTSAGEQKIH
jgi:imidazolonepropionase-like amidohydrolase